MNITELMISKVLDRGKVSKTLVEREMICSQTDEMLSIGASSTIPKSKDFLIGDPAKVFRHSSPRGRHIRLLENAANGKDYFRKQHGRMKIRVSQSKNCTTQGKPLEKPRKEKRVTSATRGNRSEIGA